MNKKNNPNNFTNFMVIPSDANQIKRTVMVGLLLLIITLVSIPFADFQLIKSEPLLPIFISINFLSELITAYIFFAQYKLSRDLPLFVLGLTYLYSGFITVPYLLTYPGVFKDTGLLNAGLQTSAWIWIFWHIGFPIGIMLYIWSVRASNRKKSRMKFKHSLRFGITLTLLFVVLITFVTANAKVYLPLLLISNSYTDQLKYGYGIFVWILNAIALFFSIKASKNTQNILNLWICISVLACLLEVTLTLLAEGRYTYGWYIARINGIISAISIFIVFIVEMSFLYQKVAMNEMRLKELINIDGLTGIANRRSLDEYLKNEVNFNERITFILFDIDDYKLFNAYYGHQMGDECLKLVAQKASSAVEERESLVARYGGEEFAVIIPNCSIDKGFQISETIRQSIEKMKIPHLGSKQNAIVTCSFGISSIIVEDQMSIQKLIYQADLALYESKRKGKNQSSIFKAGIEFSK